MHFRWWLLALCSVTIAGGSGCFDDECKVCPPAVRARYDGRAFSAAELRPILAQHRLWLDENRRDDELMERNRADPRRADLSGADLAGLTEEARPEDRDVLVGADLEGATLSQTDLTGVNLSNADLTDADLSRADLDGTILAGAEISNADLSCTMFEPAPAANGNLLPRASSLVLAKHLCLLTYHDSPHGLAALRDALQKSGDSEQERQVTFALNYEARRRDMGWRRPNTPRHHEPTLQLNSVMRASFLGGAFNWLAFEITSAYGMDPGRPLKAILIIMLLCSIPFAIAIINPTSAGGIYRVWPKEGIDARDPWTERICFSLADRANRRQNLKRVLKYALFFSTSSAFQLGWHDLNVGNWIERLNTHEFSLRAKGWPRTLAGVEAVVCGFLLALWALCYFGHPFG